MPRKSTLRKNNEEETGYQPKVSFENSEKAMHDMESEDQIVPKKASNKLSKKSKKVVIEEEDELEEVNELSTIDEEAAGTQEGAAGTEEDDDDDEQPGEEEDAQTSASKHFQMLSKSAQDRAGVKFPISKLAKFAKQGKYADRIGQGVPVFMAGVLEYLTFEILELASNKAGETTSGSGSNKKVQKNILPRHIMMAVRSDEEFSRFLKGAEFHQSGRLPTYFDDNKSNKKKKGSLEDEADDEDFQMNENEEMDE